MIFIFFSIFLGFMKYRLSILSNSEVLSPVFDSRSKQKSKPLKWILFSILSFWKGENANKIHLMEKKQF